MWFLRSWLFLLTLALTVAFGAALVSPKPPANDLAKAHSYKLDLVQHNTQMLLRLDARALIDTAVEMSRDSRIAELLEQAGARQKNADALKARSDAVAMKLLGQVPAAARPELCIMVDYRGKQISRIDPEHTRFVAGRDGLAGYPLVEAALRGYLRDDTWSINGRLYVVAAAPVISRGRNRYVGALIVGQEVNKDYAAQLKKRLLASEVPFLANIELAFFLRGKQLSSTVASKTIQRLPRRFSEGRKELIKVGRSPAFALRDGKNRHIVVMAPLPGSATAHDAFYALMTPAPPPTALFGTLSRLSGKDFNLGIWLLVGGLFVVVLVISLFIAQVEAGGPVNRLLDDVRRLHRSDISTIADHKHPARTREIAKLINELVDKASGKKEEGRVIDRILGDRDDDREPSRLPTSEPAGGVALGGSMPPLAGNDDAPPSMEVMEGAGLELSAGAVGMTPLTTLDEEEAPTMVKDSSPPVPEFGAEMLEMPELSPMSSDDGGGLALPPGLVLDDDEPPAPSLQVKVTTSGGGKASSAPGIGDVEPMTIPELGPLDSGPGDPDAYFHEVYDEFVKIKKSCGENIEKLSYERFATKLRKNRDSLMERYDCRDVKFRVYIKDGKAALKATPITD